MMSLWKRQKTPGLFGFGVEPETNFGLKEKNPVIN